MTFDQLVVVRGGGDLGSGVALRLWRSGFQIVILESAVPVAVRRTVCFSEAIFDGECRVEEAPGRLTDAAEVGRDRRFDIVQVVVDPAAASLELLKPFALVDAIMAKKNLGTSTSMAPCVVALGPGFRAGDDVHAVIETNRGPHLGRVIWDGSAETNTGRPGLVGGHDLDRVLRAPSDGVLRNHREIGAVVRCGDVLAEVSGAPVLAGFDGLVRGLARNGIRVQQGMKIGDLDPRCNPALTRMVSDKSLAVAGGVLEAILSTLERSER